MKFESALYPTALIHIQIRIYPRIQNRIRRYITVWIRGPYRVDSWKKPEVDNFVLLYLEVLSYLSFLTGFLMYSQFPGYLHRSLLALGCTVWSSRFFGMFSIFYIFPAVFNLFNCAWPRFIVYLFIFLLCVRTYFLTCGKRIFYFVQICWWAQKVHLS